MKNKAFLIKPASGRCNLMCKYCFYSDEMEKREIKDFGIMSEKTAEIFIDKSLEYADGGNISYAFQGGEPTLAGFSFFVKFVDKVNEKNLKKSSINYSIQTNGILIDDEWAEFFKQNNFLVGLSLDGTKDENDINRIDISGKGTYKRIIKASEILDKHMAAYNILTVINKSNVKKINKIYNDFKKRNFRYLQFIPCLEPIGKGFGNEKYSLKAIEYEDFLLKLFDLWYRDFMNNDYVSIRFFDNIVSKICGYNSELCDMQKKCSIQNVVEADGGVYPCDYYVIDEYKLGDININSFEEIYKSEKAKDYLSKVYFRNPECDNCSWEKICGGGCRRHYIQNKEENKNYFCEAYKNFYSKTFERFKEIGGIVIRKNQEYRNKV